MRISRPPSCPSHPAKADWTDLHVVGKTLGGVLLSLLMPYVTHRHVCSPVVTVREDRAQGAAAHRRERVTTGGCGAAGDRCAARRAHGAGRADECRAPAADAARVGDAQALVVEADEEAAASTDFYQVTRIIKDRLEPDQRAAIIEMLWEVAYADGEVHDYEANLIRRVAGLLHVEDRDAGEARRRVLQRSMGKPPESA
jgi:Tellurite resistance protein TerB